MGQHSSGSSLTTWLMSAMHFEYTFVGNAKVWGRLMCQRVGLTFRAPLAGFHQRPEVLQREMPGSAPGLV